MKFEYDPETDAAYIRFSAGDIVRTEEVSPGVILDYDKDGHILGLELLDVREKLAPEALTGVTG